MILLPRLTLVGAGNACTGKIKSFSNRRTRPLGHLRNILPQFWLGNQIYPSVLITSMINALINPMHFQMKVRISRKLLSPRFMKTLIIPVPVLLSKTSVCHLPHKNQRMNVRLSFAGARINIQMRIQQDAHAPLAKLINKIISCQRKALVIG